MPSLPKGNDAEVAQTALALMRRADEGIVAQAAFGLLCEWIKSQLKHGQFNDWVESHMEVDRMTVWRWRAFAKEILKLSGVKCNTMLQLEQGGAQLLLMPPEAAPAEHLDMISRIRQTLLETKGQRAIIPVAKQCEETASGNLEVKRGRLKGEGGATRAERAAAQVGTVEEHLAEAKHFTEELLKALEGLEAKFVLMQEAEVRVIEFALDRHLKAVRAWVNTPQGRRDPQAIEAMVKA